MLTKAQHKQNLKLIKVLRSGKYKQGKHRLRTDDTYCCLGVACDIVSKKNWKATSTSGHFSYFGNAVACPPEIAAKYGWVGEGPTFGQDVEGTNICLISLNDDLNNTFPEIADKLQAWLDSQEIEEENG